MQLKALEMQGFKSFPDKTVLGFDASITAIVGPNGSGKSNISDAIRWVMGEQSTRALRGGKMEDVIFGGTQARPGVGFAQVSLTLDNEDGRLPMEESEIVVTRRYYRSGDSEYYINRHLVRLKDIHELFMDTGLGQDGYSLIGQGKIDEILAVKSTQRREVFEEAAGISRYRHRKEEAERKLERTRENLLRISDKMEELELQLEPLREQAEQAKRFFQCRDALRGLEVSLWMDRLDQLRAQHQQVGQAYEAMQGQMEQVRAETDRLYAESEALGGQIQEREQQMEQARHALGKQEEQSAACQGRISVLKVRLQGNEDNILRLTDELSSWKRREEDLAQQIRSKQSRLEALQGEAAQWQRKLEELESNSRGQAKTLVSYQTALDQLTRRMLEEGASTQEAESLLSALGASAQEVEERRKALNDDLTEVARLLEQARQDEARELEILAKLERSKQAAHSQLVQKEAAEQRAQTAEKTAEDQWVALRMEENALLARIHMLEEMEKLYEGYSKAVKTVMDETRRGGLRGIHGPVAGLIQVPSDYAVAIEIALGGAMQHLVVETQDNGKAVLGYLKRKDAGRVTCLPLDSMRPTRLQETGLEQAEGFLGVAAELIGCDPRYEKVFSNLLGRVVVARDLDCAVAIAQRYGYRFRIVTLDGQVLSPGGSMTGGSVSKKGGILSRAKELERLGETQAQLKGHRLEAEGQLEQAQKAHAAARHDREAAREAAGNRETELLVVRGKAEGQRTQLEELLRQRDRLLEERGRLQAKTDASQGKQEKTRAQLQQMRSAVGSLSEEREALERQLEQLRQAELVRGDERRELGLKLAGIDSEERVTVQSLEELKGLGQTLTEDYQRQQSEIRRLEQENAALQDRRQQEEALGHTLLEQKETCKQVLEGLSGEKLALEGKRSQAERDGRSQNETLLYCQREITVLEQKKLSGEQEESQLLDKLWERYELSHEGALAIRRPLKTIREAENAVSALKGEIRALGNVNLGAVEEYERISERYGYLLEQREDVEDAAENLVKIIEDLTGEMKVIFKREFGRINQAFQETFLTLFQGGKAALRLEDEEDLLHCGIEIQVQPPGKNLNNLSLLSGGEKAFVAIALYFAILQVRPTPFCVLDEIEAALDDVNVLRFARYLRSNAARTQFIVITHRRGTMEEADVLYGVTMERQGISKLLRLNLNEAEQAVDGMN